MYFLAADLCNFYLPNTPDHVEPFLRSLAEKHRLSVKEDLEEGTYVTLRNDSVARECVKVFVKQFLPGFAGTEHEEYLSCKRYYCGDLARAELHNNKHKYPWDDSTELYSQTNALNDGRIVKAVAWSEYGQSYVDFEISAEDLPEMDIEQLLAYLAEQGYDAFNTADKSKLTMRRKNSYQRSISKTASPDRPDYVITWAQ
jgi:hypothetical protein